MPFIGPNSQWAQVVQKDGSVQYQTISVPQIKPDELLVKLQYSGVCHSDLRLQKGGWPLQIEVGLVGGHEGAGAVAQVGERVTDFEIGDPVGIKILHNSCDACEHCTQGHEQICKKAVLSGVHVNGTFQQYCVCKASHAARIPRGMDMALAAPIMCAGVTAFRALKQCDLKPGQIVAIAGAGGGVGIMACHFAKAYGCRVLAISHGAKKRDMCFNELGADYFVDYADSADLVAEVKELTSGGPHVVIIASASEALVHSAVQYVRTSGTVVPLGLPPDGRLNANLFDIIARMVKIEGSWVGNTEDVEEALQVFHSNKFQMPHQIMNLQDLPLVYKMIEAGELVGRIVLKIPQESPDRFQEGLSGISSKSVPEKWNIGNYLASRLETLGVKHFFTVPGDYNLYLLDELVKNTNLQMIGCCNELNAGYAADGYARVSPSGIAVVVVTHMVGTMSVINAIAGAYSERLKVIVINGSLKSSDYQSSRIVHHTIGNTDKEQSQRIFNEVTCASVRLRPTPDIGKQLDAVLVHCIKKSLPVYIEIPMDTLQTTCLAPDPFTIPRLRSPRDKASAAAGLIEKTWVAAKNPVILIGGLTRLHLSHEIVSSFVSKLGCAVFCLPDGKSHIRNSHPQFCGIFWSRASDPEIVTTVMESDLWVVVGGHWSDIHTIGSATDLDKEKGRIMDLGGDCIRMPDGTSIDSIVLRDVIDEVVNSSITQKDASLKQFRSATSIAVNGTIPSSPESQLTVSHVVSGIEQIIQKDDIVLADAGDNWFQAASMKLPDGVDLHMQMLYCSIGWGLPASMGSQLAQSKGRSIVMIGDGAFQMTAQEVSTMIRVRSNAIVIIVNNLGYRIETAIHDGPYNYIANWQYANLVSSMCSAPHTSSQPNPYLPEEEKRELMSPAMFSMKIQTYGDLMQALDRTQKEPDKLAILECCVHPDDLNPMLMKFGSVLHSGVTQTGKNKMNRQEPGANADTAILKSLKLGSLCSARLVIEENQTPVVYSKDHTAGMTSHMLTCAWSADSGWKEPKIIPSTLISLSPVAPGLNYGIQCFEGMKAYRGYDGKLRLLRPELNFKRLVKSALSVGLPEIDVDEVQKLLEALLRLDGPQWLPNDAAGSFLYIRPVFLATDASIGLRGPSEALLYVVCVQSPPFNHSQEMSLVTSPTGRCRAWPGGFGDCKVGGNYGPTIPTQTEDTEAGYSGTLWLLGDDCQVTEAGANNFFVIWQATDGGLEMVTAPLEDGIILPGITRQSVLDLACAKLKPLVERDGQKKKFDVQERKFTMHEIVTASEEGRLVEAFTTGTAHFIRPVSRIHFRGKGDIFLPLAHGQPAEYTELFKGWLEEIMYGNVEHSWAKVVDDA